MAGSPYEVVATALKTIIDTEFAAEGIKAIHDNIHESLGRRRVSVGIAPDYEASWARDAQVQETWITVKFYDLWTDEITPETVVNPLKITAYAERFRDAIRRARVNDVATGQMWFFDLQRVNYTDDPTGNKSRFVASIRAYGNNSGVVETSA
jgi:hypothetical protein